jgi:predicted transcriptional regulator
MLNTLTKRRFLIPNNEDLHELRLDKGISQAELARLAGGGFSQPLIARIEKGTVNPPLSKVRRLLEVLYENTNTGSITAKDIAVSPVLLAVYSDTMAQVIEKMGREGVSQLPVQDIVGRLVGSITEKKLAEHIIARGKDALKQPVSAIMEPPLPEIDANASITEIQNQLVNIPALIVKDGEKVSGIITKTDLLQYFSAIGK